MTANELLDALDKEIKKYLDADEAFINSTIKLLVEMGVYPATTPHMEKSNSSHRDMVENYGARWHEYQGVLDCPECKADLRDHANGPPFILTNGVEVRGIYDGVLFWQCSKCGHEMPREGLEIPYGKYKNLKPKNNLHLV